MSKAFIFLAPGFEDMEAIAPIDILRRGEVEVEIVGVTEIANDSSHGVCVTCDSEIDYMESNISPEDVLIFPGGLPGSSNLAADKNLVGKLNKHYGNGGRVAAICAAPALVLASCLNYIKEGTRMTCYPGFESVLEEHNVTPVNEGVVVCENVITAKGPAYCIEFGLAILETIRGKEAAEKVAKGILLK
ncbi:MAG: DJ-1/PfpI family protein [Bacteroidales bacterium]|nr:DJ-1/PfpI family protein [Bacteroidales bacterium]